jgi:hypothetical protein
MGTPCLPRPLAVLCSITQVDLGTHDFTTGGPIFQNIADNIHNIPVASCAFLDMRTKDDRALPLKLKRARGSQSKKRSHSATAADVHFHPAANLPRGRDRD